MPAMGQARDYDDSVWERVFDFTFPDERDMTREQVQAELHRLGIDIRPAISKIHEALAHAREAREARETLEQAKKERLSTLAKLSGIEVPSFPEMRATLERMIREYFSGSQQTLYARKLERAASDEDLKSLLEDISRLKKLSDETGDAER
jgi:hypothetical protein